MKQEELQKLIEQLEKQLTNDKSSFGIFHYGGSTAESYIQADPEGLKRFALELLKAADKMGYSLNETDKEIIHLNLQSNWLNEHSDTFIQFIEPASTQAKPVEINKTTSYQENKTSVADKILPLGCLLGFIILLVALFIGLWTIGKWLF